MQITHVGTAGSVGLSAVDFKLTDRFADVPENQDWQIEALLPMDGCVYPYRHVPPATEHPFHRFLKRSLALEGIVGSADAIALDLGRTLLAKRSVPTLIEL